MFLYVQRNPQCLLIELSFHTLSQEIIVLTIPYQESTVVLINYIAFIPNYLVVLHVSFTPLCPVIQ